MVGLTELYKRGAIGAMKDSFAYASRGSNLGSSIMGKLSFGLRALARNPALGRAVPGAVIGAGYGAFSDDTSVLGGALTGAAIGAGSVPLGRGARAGMSYYRGMRSMGQGRGRSAYVAMYGMGQDSARYIGGGFTKAYNTIKGLPSSATGLGFFPG